jgi:hypothetical protein
MDGQHKRTREELLDRVLLTQELQNGCHWFRRFLLAVIATVGFALKKVKINSDDVESLALNLLRTRAVRPIDVR